MSDFEKTIDLAQRLKLMLWNNAKGKSAYGQMQVMAETIEKNLRDSQAAIASMQGEAVGVVTLADDIAQPDTSGEHKGKYQNMIYSHAPLQVGAHVFTHPPSASAEIARKDASITELEARKDAAYFERNQCVALIARMALVLGHDVAVTKTAIDGWSEDWHGCVYIELPTGQVSWHFHDSQAYLFEGLPSMPAVWDGHDTPEKYRRVNEAFIDIEQKAEIDRLTKELEEARKDAERYRMMRSLDVTPYEKWNKAQKELHRAMNSADTVEMVDTAIDAAIRQIGGGE